MKTDLKRKVAKENITRMKLTGSQKNVETLNRKMTFMHKNLRQKS